MASLDLLNLELNGDYRQRLEQTVNRVKKLKKSLKNAGYKAFSNEPLKLTLLTKEYGYLGVELSKILEDNGVFCEFSDKDFLVMMFTENSRKVDFERIEKVLLSIPKKPKIYERPPEITRLKNKISIRKATLSNSQILPVEKCEGRVLCSLNLSCPPAVQIVCVGEVITKKAIEVLRYYDIKKCKVLK